MAADTKGGWMMFKYQVIDADQNNEVIAMFREEEDMEDFLQAYDEIFGLAGLKSQIQEDTVQWKTAG